MGFLHDAAFKQPVTAARIPSPRRSRILFALCEQSNREGGDDPRRGGPYFF
jgi:hypothetical protein